MKTLGKQGPPPNRNVFWKLYPSGSGPRHLDSVVVTDLLISPQGVYCYDCPPWACFQIEFDSTVLGQGSVSPGLHGTWYSLVQVGWRGAGYERVISHIPVSPRWDNRNKQPRSAFYVDAGDECRC